MLALPGLAFAVVTVTPLLVPLTARADTDPGKPCAADVKKLCTVTVTASGCSYYP